ncbi:MAG: tetratricopeptide repeat protein, partial [Nannocystaceae bacterium]
MRWVPRAWLAALCACASPGTHTPPAASVEATESTPPADVAALPPAPPISDLNDAKAAIHEGRLDPAIAFLRAWTREHPDELSAQLNLAHALQLSGAIAEAQQTLDAVADRDPVAARRAAELRAGLGDLSGAVAQLEDASTRWPD